MRRILFADTNIFIQIKDLDGLSWVELFPDAPEIDIMVAPSVLDELDKHKGSTNRRRRDRSRLALHLIEQASTNQDYAIVLESLAGSCPCSPHGS